MVRGSGRHTVFKRATSQVKIRGILPSEWHLTKNIKQEGCSRVVSASGTRHKTYCMPLESTVQRFLNIFF